LINRCWSGFLWIAALATAVTAAAALYFQSHIDELIRQRIESQIAQHYTGLKVSVRSVRLVGGEGIRAYDISIVDPSLQGADAELLRIEEARLTCPTEWKRLLTGDVPVERIEIRRPVLRVSRGADGGWSTGKLLPPPKMGASPPAVEVRHGAIELSDPLKSPPAALTLREVNLSMQPPERGEGREERGEGPNNISPRPLAGEGPGVRAFGASSDTVLTSNNPHPNPLPKGEGTNFMSLPKGEGANFMSLPKGEGTNFMSLPKGEGANFMPLPKGEGPRARRLQGSLAADAARRIEFSGWVDLHAPACSIQGEAEAVEISPELRDALPEPIARHLLALGNLRGQTTLRFAMDYDPAVAAPLKFDVSGRLERGRFDDPRLPHALTEIRATARVNNGGLIVDDLSARIGQATLRMSCRRWGFAADSPLRLSAEVRQLDVDRALLDILPPSMQDQWRRYLPAGRIDADVQLDFDGHQWRPIISARWSNASLTYHKFPYRLEHGKGTVELNDSLLKMNVIAYSGSQPVRLAAEARDPFGRPFGWFEAKGDDIQLDEALIAALPDQTRKLARAFDPRGKVNVYFRLWREQPEQPLHKHLWVELKRCTICYEKFPYPMTNVRGAVEMIDDQWTFRNLEGDNDTARVTCQGRLSPGLGGNELVLRLTGRDVPLEDELRDALSPHLRQVWCDLQPRGLVDVEADVSGVPGKGEMNIDVRLRPQPQSTSIEPARFPYRLERLEGSLRYRDGHVAFERCRSEHGPVKISADGFCDFQRDGRWLMQLTNFTADRARLDRELLQALPEQLKKAAAVLNPGGAINLRGELEFQRDGPPAEPLRSRWDVVVGMQQGTLRCGGATLENICGEVALRGQSDGRNLQCRGELALDSLSFRDLHVGGVAGPIWIDDEMVLFGQWADQRAAERRIAAIVPCSTGAAAAGHPPAHRPLTAAILDGKFVGNGWITLESTPRFGLNATLLDADLAQCSQEFAPGTKKLRGRLTATADMQGSGLTCNSLAGGGTVRMSQGDVYELPIMVALLKILSIRPPQRNAFSDGAIVYRVEGEHVYFDQIDFRGDAISLRGKGEMDFQSAIHLTFYATVGRGELELPLVNQVFRGASQQLMLIHVDGTLQKPETRKEALPAVGQALQQLRGEKKEE
jgi:hypothetical protein